MITEKNIGLFREIKDEDCIILHCISADKVMGAGIAKPLQNTFKIKERWPVYLPKRMLGWNKEGYCVFVLGDTPVQLIGNLITKGRYFDKPTYDTLEQSLNDARYTLGVLAENGFTIPNKIVMPKIGCGLDRLEWNKVKPIIEKVFVYYNIVVCYL